MACALLLSAVVLAKVRSAAVFGVEALDVFVEVDSAHTSPTPAATSNDTNPEFIKSILAWITNDLHRVDPIRY